MRSNYSAALVDRDTICLRQGAVCSDCDLLLSAAILLLATSPTPALARRRLPTKNVLVWPDVDRRMNFYPAVFPLWPVLVPSMSRILLASAYQKATILTGVAIGPRPVAPLGRFGWVTWLGVRVTAGRAGGSAEEPRSKWNSFITEMCSEKEPESGADRLCGSQTVKKEKGNENRSWPEDGVDAVASSWRHPEAAKV